MLRRLCILLLCAAAGLDAGAAAKPAASAPAERAQTYKVRVGDTLGAIAKKFGTSSVALATFNRLEDADELQEGQVLKIPPAAARPSAPAAPKTSAVLPAGVRASIDKIRVVPGKWRYIVIHHSASAKGTPQGMDAYHRNVRRMENGLAYHFVIGNGAGMADGSIHTGARWRGQLAGGHLASESLNAKAIGICLVGNFDATRPTAKEMQSLQALVAYLRQRCKLPASAVKLHRQINTRPTECPGDKFPAAAFFSGL